MTLLLSESMELANDDVMSDETSDASFERRRGLRVRQQRPVKVYETTTARYFGGRTEDVSTTGLRIELPAFAPIREGETLNIHVGLSNTGESLANRRQMIPARVVWINRRLSEKGGRIHCDGDLVGSGLQIVARIGKAEQVRVVQLHLDVDILRQA